MENKTISRKEIEKRAMISITNIMAESSDLGATISPLYLSVEIVPGTKSSCPYVRGIRLLETPIWLEPEAENILSNAPRSFGDYRRNKKGIIKSTLPGILPDIIHVDYTHRDTFEKRRTLNDILDAFLEGWEGGKRAIIYTIPYIGDKAIMEYIDRTNMNPKYKRFTKLMAIGGIKYGGIGSIIGYHFIK